MVKTDFNFGRKPELPEKFNEQPRRGMFRQDEQDLQDGK
jgi:hypothetical protein